jgi:hypothetical protein
MSAIGPSALNYGLSGLGAQGETLSNVEHGVY